MGLMVCADLVCGTTEQSCHYHDIIWYYQLYEILWNFLNNTLDVPQPCLLVITANLALAGCLGWKWGLWPVPAWLAVQRRIAVFFLTLYESINDMKQFQNVCITPQPCHSHFVVGCCQFGPSWIFGMKMDLMVCSCMIDGILEQSCIFLHLIW